MAFRMSIIIFIWVKSSQNFLTKILHLNFRKVAIINQSIKEQMEKTILQFKIPDGYILNLHKKQMHYVCFILDICLIVLSPAYLQFRKERGGDDTEKILCQKQEMGEMTYRMLIIIFNFTFIIEFTNKLSNAGI